TGDSVFLVVRSGFDSVCIERIEGSYPITARTLDVGGRRPLGSGAGSLAILINLPEPEMERVIEVNTPRFREFGHLTLERLRSAIRISRRVGYAVNDEDVLANVGAIGMPLRLGQTGTPYAAVSIAGIASRFAGRRREELAQSLAKELHTLEKKVG
ncbi:MAG TPA: IclR family transcriptional regulator C-terminal domain-containing protein, partial [Casimicrobiaceae bacterium]|nr:IclR family transcriptional regulator C-terminal domain-containing protein [Casimicrobiaceae bacterium]